jgi:DNA-binding CsgD family transcriptional regulator
MLAALGDVAGATTSDDLADAVLAATHTVVGADSTAVTQVGRPDALVRSWPSGLLSTERLLAFEALNGDEPWPLATHTRTGSGYPLRSSDFYSQRQYRRLAIYGELFRSLEVDYQAAFSVPVEGDLRLCVVVDRKGRDFSDTELDRLAALWRILSACRPHAVGRPWPPDAARRRLAPLTPRQADVLSLVAEGQSNDQVGRRLGISSRTVNKHLEHVYERIGACNRTEAARRWLECGGRTTPGRAVPRGGPQGPD